MANSVYRRCGCRGQDGKQYGASCPQLKSDAKHGLWAYLLSYGSEPDPSQPGRRRRRQFRKGGYRTKGEAQKALTKLRAELDNNTYVEPSKITLAQYATEWLKRRQTTGKGLRPTTAANYRRYVEHDIIPSKLGKMLLSDIRRHPQACLPLSGLRTIKVHSGKERSSWQ